MGRPKGRKSIQSPEVAYDPKPKVSRRAPSDLSVSKEIYTPYQQLNHRNSVLNMQFTYEIRSDLYTLLSATWHWNFQRLFITARHDCFILEIEKKKAKCHQIDFSHSNGKCGAAVKCLLSQNGPIKFY